MEKRRHDRMAVDNLAVDISDGLRFFTGTLYDLSRAGLKLQNVPKRLDEKAKKLSVIISGQDKHFKMVARPRWSERQAISKHVGLEIVRAPLGWAEFVMEHEPNPKSDLTEISI